MRRRLLASSGSSAAVAAVLLFALVPVSGQAPAPGTPSRRTPSAPAASRPAPPRSAPSKTTVPRTPWGHPDLQGFWATPSTVATPLERPESVGGQEFLSDEDLAAREAWVRNRRDNSNTASRFQPNADPVGNYNDFWTPEEARMSKRTALIVDPPSGRVPSLTPAAQKKEQEEAAARRSRGPDVTDDPEDLGLWSRCITRVGAPIIPGPYNNNYQIVQSPTSVAIIAEVIDIRIIPLDGRPHAPSNVRGYLGDSRGRWEGDTLVVETTNFNNRNNFRGSGEGLRLVERFTRTSPNSLNYEFTVEDPTTFTAPWTATNTMSTLDGVLYEYACHEANISMFASLQGARAAEKQKAPGTAPAGSPR